MANDRASDNVYYIPDNIAQQNRIFGFRKRNLIEAGVAAFGVGWLINLVPFVPKVKLIVIAVVCGGLIILFVNGVHGRSVTESFLAYMRFRSGSKKLHYRDIRKSKQTAGLSKSGERLSYAERTVEFIKDKTTNSKGENPVFDALNTLKGRLG